MKKINPKDFTDRGWKEHYSGYPKDLFYGPGKGEPWENKPHLHLNYSIQGEMRSLTYKDTLGRNYYLYRTGGKWDEDVFKTITDEKIQAEARFAKGYAE